MKTLQEATVQICDLKGSLLAQQALINALLKTMQPDHLRAVEAVLYNEQEAARGVLLGSLISEHTISAFERDAQLASGMLDRLTRSGL